jgi:membrane protease YdiL (CAAX protease family)
VAPLCEEFFFRGFMFGVLRERIGVAGGALLTGLIFGGVHATGSPVETLGVLVVLGVLLCLLYWRTGSLLPCIALHALNNGISFVVTTDVPVGEAIAIVFATSSAAVAVGVLVMRRVRRLPGLPPTPR